MGKKHKRDPIPWHIYLICLTILATLGTAIYLFGGMGADKKISRLEEESRAEYEAHLECKTQVSELNTLLADEKKKFGQVEWKYKQKDMKR